MKTSNGIFHLRTLCAALGLAWGAGGAWALALGESRGQVVLGAPIDLRFDVTPDAGQSLADSCLSVRLKSGESAIAEGRVRITPMAQGARTLVRVQSDAVADEPVFTAVLQAGCTGAVTRTYVYLVDPPAAQLQAPADVPRVPIVVQPVRAAADEGARAAAAQGAGAPAARARSQPVVRKPRPPRPPAPAKAAAPAAVQTVHQTAPPAALSTPAPAAAAAAPVAAGGGRLVVEPAERWLAAQGGAGPEVAAAAPQPPLAEQMQELLARSQQEQQAQAEQQQAQFKAMQASMLELRQQLAQVQSERFSATVVYGLVGLLLLALASVFWLLWRARTQAQQAWQRSVALSTDTHVAMGVLEEDDSGGPPTLRTQPRADDVWEHTAALMQPHESVLPATRPAPLRIPAAPEDEVYEDVADTVFQPQTIYGSDDLEPSDPTRPVDVALDDADESLQDVLQLAEFYVSIGEHDRATQRLALYLQQHADASPLVSLELLRLYHQLGDTVRFAALREAVGKRFNVRVPAFFDYPGAGRGLLDCPNALAQVTSLWASAELQPWLEEAIACPGQGFRGDILDLPAFEDLLLLQSIAASAAPRGGWPARAPAAAFASTAAAEPAAAQLPDLDFDLDVDLGQGPEVSLEPLSASAEPAAVGDDEVAPTEPADLTPAVGFGLRDEKLDVTLEQERQRSRF